MKRWRTKAAALILAVAMVFTSTGEGVPIAAAEVSKAVGTALSTVQRATNGTELLSFGFLQANNTGLQIDFACKMDPASFQLDVILPAGANVKTLKPYFTISGAKLMAGDKEVIANETVLDFTNPIDLTVTSDAGVSATYHVSVRALDTGLPSVTAYTENMAPIVSKKDYIKGTAAISGGTVDYAANLESSPMRIRGRGNSSWTDETLQTKLPYRMKFDTKTEVLGMGKAKDWVLIANQSDKSLLRNYAAYELNRRLDNTKFYAKMKPVDFFLNGEYKGQYLIGDQMEVQKNRIDITEPDLANPSTDTGYFLEINARIHNDKTGIEGIDYFRSNSGIVYEFKSPDNDEITLAQKSYIIDEINEMEYAMRYSEDYEDYIDVDSMIDWYIINEIFRNPDSRLDLSTYIYKDGADDVFHFGPVWDFDIAAGNTDYDLTIGDDRDLRNPEGWFTKTGKYFTWMFGRQEVWARVKSRWNQTKKESIFTITDFIQDSAKMVAKSAEENFKVQPIMGEYVWPNPPEIVEIDTYQGQVDFLCDFLDKRIAWMDKEFNPYGDQPVESIALSNDVMQLMVGDSGTLTVSFTPSSPSNMFVSWSVSDPTIASVKNGKVTALSLGNTTVTATSDDGGKKASCKIYVVDTSELENTILDFVVNVEANEDIYTPESYATFMEAIDHAREVLYSGLADQATLDNEVKQLQNAAKKLVKKADLSRNGWIKANGNWYYYVKGKVSTGWFTVGKTWYLSNSSGVMQTNWKKVGSKWYYFGSSGAMRTGWYMVGKTWYYSDGSGAMKTGWFKVGSQWYYANSAGAMQTGWKKIGSKWYYLGSNGVMRTGWYKVGGKWYFSNSSGAMLTGWVKNAGKWYWLNGSGAMQTGWKKIGSKWYWFDGSGKMIAGTSRKIGKKTYRFNSSGACLNP